MQVLLNKSLNKSGLNLSERTFTRAEDAGRGCIRHSVADTPLEDRSIVILGGGPSLSREVGMELAKYRSIAVNNSYIFYTHPALVVALDRRWWTWHGNAVLGAGHLGVTSLRKHQSEPQGFRGLSFQKERDLAYDAHLGTLCGQNSGHAAAHLAMHLGAKRIYLAGFDMGFSGNQTHWHGGHNVPSSLQNYQKRFLPALNELVRVARSMGVEFLSVTPTSATIPVCSVDAAVKDLST